MSEPFTPTPSDHLSSIRFVKALRRHALMLILLTAAAVGSAAIYSATTPKQYKASSDLLIQPLSTSDELYQGLSLFRQTFDGASSVVTAARLITSPVIRRPVFDQLGEDRIGASVLVRPLGQANIVTIEATAPDPQQAARVANAYAAGTVRARNAQFQREIAQRIKRLRTQVDATPSSLRADNFEYASLQQRLADYRALIGTADPTISKLTDATPPTSASWPRPKLSMAVAFFGALLLGIGIAMLLEVVNPRIASEEELLLEQRLPILTRVPLLSQKVARGYLTGRSTMPSGAWKSYRILRAVLDTLGPDGRFPRSILITGASPGDGKTTTAVNLAITLASSNTRVILVDGDLHRPMISTVFNVPAGRGGVAALMSGRVAAEQCLVKPAIHPRLSLLLASREDGSRVHLDRARFTRMLEQLAPLCDVVVVDSPPLGEVAEVLDMADSVDSVLLCVRLGRTRREKLNQARELLARRGVSPEGFVVTMRQRLTRDDEYGYGGYGGDLQAEATAAQPPEPIPTERRAPRSSVVRLTEK